MRAQAQWQRREEIYMSVVRERQRLQEKLRGAATQRAGESAESAEDAERAALPAPAELPVPEEEVIQREASRSAAHLDMVPSPRLDDGAGVKDVEEARRPGSWDA